MAREVKAMRNRCQHRGEEHVVGRIEHGGIEAGSDRCPCDALRVSMLTVTDLPGNGNV